MDLSLLFFLGEGQKRLTEGQEKGIKVMATGYREQSYVKHTEAGRIPDTTRRGEWMKRLRADSAILREKPGLVIAASSVLLVGVLLGGYALLKRRRNAW